MTMYDIGGWSEKISFCQWLTFLITLISCNKYIFSLWQKKHEMLIANKKLQKHLALFPVEKRDKDNKVRVMKGNCNCPNLLWWKHPTQTLTKFSSVRTRKVWIYKETENQNPNLSNRVDIAIRKLPSSVQAIKYKLSKCSSY